MFSFMETQTAFVGVGSNLGDKRGYCLKAIDLLDEMEGITVKQRSSLYRSAPIGPQNQDWFVNAVIRLQTSLSPQELLAAVHLVEMELERKRERRWGPRTIDLDILFYNDEIIENEALRIPHPEIDQRHFVLLPLAEIAPRFQHPEHRKTILQLLRNLTPKTECYPLPPEKPQINQEEESPIIFTQKMISLTS